MPIQKLISDCDNIPFHSKTCCYGACSNKPITSHTISENYLFKLSDDLANVLTFQPKVSQVVKAQNSQHVMKVDKKKFSTFTGFCETHDHQLFKLIDSFNGVVDKEKAVLVHYRNICYGIHHIKAQRKRERYIAQQNYTGESSSESDEIMNKLITGSLTTRLTYCLNEHLLRKKLLEHIISSRNFDAIDFIEIPITSMNPSNANHTLVYTIFNNSLSLKKNVSSHCWVKSFCMNNWISPFLAVLNLRGYFFVIME